MLLFRLYLEPLTGQMTISSFFFFNFFFHFPNAGLVRFHTFLFLLLKVAEQRWKKA